ncbi:AraC family transcriptional regulator [Paracoccus sp. WLY502]|uniref:helix-turn-helix domain-containing protein n=1 Tax=Paracoccus yibinensis TaxID=3068891 RepID=UPI0027968A00|nr:AraC family transcriptional regulator [Paracoccus sp. WLY502]MDQ1900836.1 AraC family transcriptional regulator [Paracoccus sp. WLY502]
MGGLIPFEELPEWVPGKVLLASDGQNWKRVALRSYHYQGQDVVVPAMRDFMLVSYRTGTTPMQRRFDGRWKKETLGPGAASLLTRAQQAYWNWHEPIDVTHVYLSGEMVAEVASEVMDCAVSEVTLDDVLRVDDPVMSSAADAIAGEARNRALGGSLYVDTVARGLIIHLLRRYASVRQLEPERTGVLTPQQEKRIVEFIETEIETPLDLKVMADALNMTPCLFARQFRRSFNMPAYAFVKARRLERARRLLATTELPIKAIASDCGFCDQAHLTRMFSSEFGMPPGEFRRRAH